MKIYYTNPNVKVSSRNSRLVKTSFSSSIRKSDFSRSFFSWIESNNNFYFQLIGIFILTVGMVLSLQNFLDGTKLNASAKENSDVRILTNFQQSIKTDSDSGKLQEVISTVTPPTVLNEVAKTVEENFVEYTVKDKDTIQTIAIKFKVSVPQITNLNKVPENTNLIVGSKIKVPFNT